ncbi:unnamed protein product, partial [Pylaiella littoralis]
TSNACKKNALEQPQQLPGMMPSNLWTLSAQLDFANVEPSLVKLVRRCGGFALM